MTKWYESGGKMLEERGGNGRQESLISWHENGQKHIETNYKYVEHEVETTSKNGRIEKHTEELKVEDGLYIEWYPNGKKKLEKHYKDEKENGLRTEWSEDGKKTFEEHS